MRCSQTVCTAAAVWRYDWPGRERQYACAEHLGALLRVADLMGVSLRVVALDAVAVAT